MKVLMIWDEIPSIYNPSSSTALNLLKHLGTHHDIDLIYADTAREKEREYPDLGSYCTTVSPVAFQSVSSMGAQLTQIIKSNLSIQKLFSDHRFFFSSHYSREFANVVTTALTRERYDIIYVSGPMAPYVANVAAPKIVHAFDCFSQHRLQRAHLSTNLAHKLYWIFAHFKDRLIERHVYSRFDACIVVSEEELSAMGRAASQVRVVVVPGGVDTDYFRPACAEERLPSLVFVGHMDAPVNIDAALFFCQHIFDQVKQSVPNTTLEIVGPNPVDEIINLAKDGSIHLTGFVEDVRPYIERATVFIAPLVSGSGIKYKILEAMAMGKAVVTTSIGIRGIDAIIGKDALVADSPAEFGSFTIELIRNEALRNHIGQNARRLVQTLYSWKKIAEEVDLIFHRAVKEHERQV